MWLRLKEITVIETRNTETRTLTPIFDEFETLTSFSRPEIGMVRNVVQKRLGSRDAVGLHGHGRQVGCSGRE